MIPVICCFARCFVATGGESSTLFLLDQREGERDGGFSGTWGRVTNTLLHMKSAANFISLFLEQKKDIVEVNLGIKKK